MKNILISRFYKQFSLNGSAMAPEQLFEKISNVKNMNMLYIILKHVIWRFRIYNYLREIFKFRDFMNALRNFAKSVFAHIFKKFEYFVKVIIYYHSISGPNVCLARLQMELCRAANIFAAR